MKYKVIPVGRYMLTELLCSACGRRLGIGATLDLAVALARKLGARTSPDQGWWCQACWRVEWEEEPEIPF